MAPSDRHRYTCPIQSSKQGEDRAALAAQHQQTHFGSQARWRVHLSMKEAPTPSTHSHPTERAPKVPLHRNGPSTKILDRPSLALPSSAIWPQRANPWMTIAVASNPHWVRYIRAVAHKMLHYIGMAVSATSAGLKRPIHMYGECHRHDQCISVRTRSLHSIRRMS